MFSKNIIFFVLETKKQVEPFTPLNFKENRIKF